MTQSSSSAEPRVLYAQDGLVMAQIDTVCVAFWRSKPTPERFKVQKSYLADVVRAHPGTAAFMVVVEAGSEPPDEPERKGASQMITEHGTNLSCVACVIEGSGFRAAITRSVLSGIVFFIRSPSPIKYFESAASASAWMSSYVKFGPMAAFVRKVEDLRKLL